MLVVIQSVKEKMRNHRRIIIKRSGVEEKYDPKKISESIWSAAQTVGGKNKTLAIKLSKEVIGLLNKKYPNGEKIKSLEIGGLVEKTLIENGHAKTSKTYILFRENKKHLAKDKKSLEVEDDIGLSYNTLYILKRRFLNQDKDGKTIETPMEMLNRVAHFLSKAENTKKKQDEWYEKFMSVMKTFEFLPGTRTLANAGKDSPQLANCFVWPVNDDINHIFEILYKSTLVKKHGGGCGYNFSNIRPEGDMVSGTPDLAAGPIKMIEMYNLMTGLFSQKGRSESGNMAVLNADHPDIFNFISAKQSDGYLSKTNISVGITDKFMEAALKDKNWDLINPRTGEVVNTVRAKSVLQLMAQMAWATGDPGIINLSAINKGTARANPLLKSGRKIEATNPCGEVPLFPYESCNLGYVNFAKMIKGKEFDFKRLKEVMNVAVRLMDNVVESSWFPVDEVTKAVREHRRIGIGAVGWAETLARMEIPYDSKKALLLAEKVTETMYKQAFKSSCDLAEEKSPFPLINESIWKNKKRQPRNVSFLTFPPSSSNAVLCETSYGIEPYFALAFEQNVLGGMRLNNTIPAFIDKIKELGIYSEELVQKVIDNHGSVQGIKEIPIKWQKIFKVAHDISWRDHIKMQGAFQKWTDNAITKTVNLPSSATSQDIEEAYTLAWKLGCKGLTVYRDNARKDQVISFGSSKVKEKLCPECEIKLIKEKKCLKCKKCGFSTCEL